MKYNDLHYMDLAILQAELAYNKGEMPVGAVLIYKDHVVVNHNRTVEYIDMTAHAEMNVIKQMQKLAKSHYLNEAKLYVTLEPCNMCKHAISLVKINCVYFGTAQNTTRDSYSITCYDCINEDKCADLLKTFFLDKRK